MGLFGTAHGWGAKSPPSKNLSAISYNYETCHSCNLNKEDPKNI